MTYAKERIVLFPPVEGAVTALYRQDAQLARIHIYLI